MSIMSHPRIIPDRIEKGRCQTAMAPGCLGCNTLVIFPTGFGKTVIVLKVAVEFLGEREITILVPTEPLVNQRSRFFSEMLSGTARLPCAS
ncbi:MAG: DEAD/DEAH box helicase family protein [Candidatus Methanomethylophilaceae archaeon]|nr:DEAD/DEAH box helicase family protein [Candidatus Methanomethylophilaceae archaeon]